MSDEGEYLTNTGEISRILLKGACEIGEAIIDEIGEIRMAGSGSKR